MVRELLIDAINNGYNILYNGELLTIDIDIKEYIELHKEDKQSIYVLAELVKLSDEELSQLILQ